METTITAKKQLKISLPMAFENLVTTLMSLIDTIIIANLGTTYLTAVGAMSVVINILQLTPQAINVSNIALITKNKDNQQDYLSQALSLSVLLAILSIIIGFALSPVVPLIFNISSIGNIYLYIRLAGFIQSSLLTIIYGYMRVNGKQNLVFILQIISVVLNLVFDILAVSLGGGIIGVALVTICIDTLVMLSCFLITKFKFNFKIIKQKMKELLNLFKWNFLERIISKVDFFVFNILVARIGQVEFAVHTLLVQISDTAQSFIQGYSDGFTITISKFSELDEMASIAKLFKKIFIYSTGIFTVLILGISLGIIYLSFNSYELIVLSLQLLPFLIVTVSLITIASFYFSYLRGVRQFKFLAIRNLISSIIKIVVATVLSFTILGVFGVWTAYFIYNVSQFLLSKLKYKKITKPLKQL